MSLRPTGLGVDVRCCPVSMGVVKNRTGHEIGEVGGAWSLGSALEVYVCVCVFVRERGEGGGRERRGCVFVWTCFPWSGRLSTPLLSTPLVVLGRGRTSHESRVTSHEFSVPWGGRSRFVLVTLVSQIHCSSRG